MIEKQEVGQALALLTELDSLPFGALPTRG